MKRVQYIEDVPKAPGTKVRVGGRVTRVKELKNARFVWIRDITGIIQVSALYDKISKELADAANALAPNDFVVVEGNVPEKIITDLGIEIMPTNIEVVGKSLLPSPIDIEGTVESGFDKRFEWRALDLRGPEKSAIFRIQSKLVEGMRKHFSSKDFTEVFTPLIMGVPAEGGSEVFSIDYFGGKAFLRQDPQLHRQLLMVAGFEKVFEIGPSWRAELSNTPRHLTEHRTCVAEISFISSEKDTMRLEEKVIVSGIKNVIKKCGAELKLLNAELEIPKTPFPELRFPKIYGILEGLGIKTEYGQDYSREAEKALGNYVKEKYGSDFFFVNRFPSSVKPFYVMRVDSDPRWARSVDLLYKGLELSSGGQREHRYEKIIEQARDKGMDLDKVKWFTDFFKYGAPPHGGFSVGIERLTMQLLNHTNIKETTLFPRTPDKIVP